MHVSPAKHSYAWLSRKCDYRTDGQTDGQTDTGQSDPYVPICFARDTKRMNMQHQTERKNSKGVWVRDWKLWHAALNTVDTSFGNKEKVQSSEFQEHDIQSILQVGGVGSATIVVVPVPRCTTITSQHCVPNYYCTNMVKRLRISTCLFSFTQKSSKNVLRFHLAGKCFPFHTDRIIKSRFRDIHFLVQNVIASAIWLYDFYLWPFYFDKILQIWQFK